MTDEGQKGARLSRPKWSWPKGSQRRKLVPVAVAMFVSVVLLGCSPTSPVGPLQFQGSVEDQIYPAGSPIAALGHKD